jgi:hypothetical protein
MVDNPKSGTSGSGIRWNGGQGRGHNRDVVFLPEKPWGLGNIIRRLRGQDGRALESEQLARRVARLDDAIGEQRKRLSCFKLELRLLLHPLPQRDPAAARFRSPVPGHRDKARDGRHWRVRDGDEQTGAGDGRSIQ